LRDPLALRCPGKTAKISSATEHLKVSQMHFLSPDKLMLYKQNKY